MSDQHARIDPHSRESLEQLLTAFPGGFNAISDIVARREAVANLLHAVAADLPPNPNVVVEDRTVPGPTGAPDVPIRIYRPTAATGVPPAVFYIHGGGMIMGGLDGEHLSAQMICEQLGALVVSTGYRKAPEHPHPAQVSDCYAALTWMGAHAGELDYDPNRVAIYGGSAGGNLCIATSMMARDHGGPSVRLMMAPYPMVDHRNVLPSTHEITEVGIWDRSANIEAWAWFLGGQEPDDYAAPLHAADLAALPPAYIDVGTVDMFRDEDLALVRRLLDAGNPVEFHLNPGAYHASEVFAPQAQLSARIWTTRLDALRRALD